MTGRPIRPALRQSAGLQTRNPNQPNEERAVDKLISNFYKCLLVLACLSMLAAFGSIVLGIVARQFGWDIQGLDGYAGYAIAATLFLALPETFRQGDHIRVTLLLQKMPAKMRTAFEYWGLGAGAALSLYLAWFAARLAWISWTTHDVSSSADATPLWIPQLSMVLGCIGFAVAFLDALAARIHAREFFRVEVPGEIAHVE
jgi:TRAP-type C4-dicarboxylate transport system permease small subunit